MASYSKIESDGEDEAHDEEIEHFDDFTLASSWERFISDIEAVCRQWTADGPKNLLKKNAAQMDFSNDLFKVKSDLKDVTKSYCMEYYFTTDDGKLLNWDSTLHDIQLCFGVKEFLLIAPQSASGVVLDAPESSKLLSAVAIALSNCSSLWPAFVPVHDSSRKAYIGIQNMGTVFTKRFEADYIGSQVPVKLMHLEGLYELFVSKFAYSTMDFSVHLFKVHFTMKLTYETFLYDDNDVQGAFSDNEYGGSLTGEIHNRRQWDDNCPWSEWYSAEDPVKGFELVAVWSEKMVESSSEMAELENSSPYDAAKWILYPNVNDGYEGNQIGFSSQLLVLIDALDTSFKAQFMEDFVSVENPNLDNSKTSRVIPPTTVVDHVLKELFHEGTSVAPTFASSDIGGLQLPDSSGDEHKISRAIKGAPLQSLFSQFCLHALWFGNCNVHAISLLWMEFVQEVRWRWEESQSLPRMPANGSIDLTTCLINQKLQMLAVCIERKRQSNEDFHDCIGSEDWASSNEDDLDEVESPIRQASVEYFTRKRDSSFSMPNDLLDSTSIASKSSTKPDDDVVSVEVKPSDGVRKGSAGAVGLKLLKSNQSMHAPFTQDTPLMTEDMHEERIQAIEACSDSFNFSAQLEKEILSSDMSAFKAANPDAVFEDFIRWHSPGDWENGDSEESASSRSSTKLESKDNWPPQGRLSQRMSEHRNLWRKIWNDAPALPVSEKKPLLDPNSEGEKILHYLETVQPHQLLEQMVCTAFRASADTLSRTSYGDFTEMTIKMDQMCRIMVSTLRPLQANSLSVDSEIIDDLRRLCVVFDHVEKLLTLAASLHRKFLDAPRLSEAIFSDYFSYYLPRMETSSTGEKVQKEFDKKQLVRIQERTVVSNMFVPPTANQSWRKVLSMGNLLNGHEPILREIIFSTRDRVSGNHYAVDPVVHQQEIEMYRMYICGTSNDLRVALSVTSCD